MKILLTVQRFHRQIVGGSEAAARGIAELLVEDGHEVDVVTSCSTDHRTWSNELPQGCTVENGVSIHRLPSIRNRTEDNFHRLDQRVNVGRPSMPWEQQLWSRRLGPDLSDYASWLDQKAANFDAAIVMTYMYPTATIGLPLLASRLPTVLFPTAHFETAFRHLLARSVVRQAHALAFLTPEEGDLVRSFTMNSAPSAVIGLPFKASESISSRQDSLPDGLRRQRYFVCVGRIDVGKGTFDLVEMFKGYKKHFPSDIKLVLVGEADTNEDDIISLGFCSEEVKLSVIEGSIALIHPSFLESFSIVLCEAWSQERPVIVNRLCDVTSGQVKRSGGGLTYGSFNEFCATLQALVTHPQHADSFGRAGSAFVKENYSRENVSQKLYALIDQAAEQFAAGTKAK